MEWETYSEPEDIKKAVFEHFSKHFSCKKLEKIFFVKHVVPPLLSEQDNSLLTRLPTRDEVEHSLHDCNSEKPPRPDGMNAGVLKHLWNLIQDEMFKCILNFFRTGSLPGGMNSSFITLIPKIDQPLQVKDYRPISLIPFQHCG